MERLTKKNDGSGSYTQFGDKYIPNHNIRHKQCVEKLGKLEDIEQELGIPLEVLFKALKKGKVWACENSLWGYSYHNVVGFNLNEVILQSKVCSYSDCDWDIDLKDYGKTWALTKEELE
jgi:hypothetical protein